MVCNAHRNAVTKSPFQVTSCPFLFGIFSYILLCVDEKALSQN